MLSHLRRFSLLLLTVLLTPALALLSILLLLVNFLDRALRAGRPAAPHDDRPLSGRASVVILNWNGRDLLEENLPSVIDAVRADGRGHEIIVVDNGSDDGSAEFLRREFPQVRVLELGANLGFARGNNAGVRAAAHDVVVLLNNDMRVDPGFLRPLLDGFGLRTFAVTSQIFLQDPAARREETGKTAAAFRRGMIDFTHREVDAARHVRAYYPALWAGGGSSAFHKGRFLELGGFRELYSPAYVEDADLSFQAWKCGYQVLFAPRSVVYHRHRASSSRRFAPGALEALVVRNQLLFTWNNISSWTLLLAHAFLLPWNCYRLARDRGLAVWRAPLGAALRLPAVARARLGAPYRAVLGDREVLALSAAPELFFARSRPRAAPAAGERPRVLWLTAYLPHLGRHAGAGRMFQLLKRIAPHYRVTLLTFLESDEEREFLPETERLCERVVAVRRRPPARWHWFPYEPFDEFRTPEMEAALRSCLEHEDFDLVQLEYTQMACYARRELGIPILLTKHEVDFAACARRARTERGPWLKLRWFYNYLQVLEREMRLLGRVDAAILMTEADRQALAKFSRGVALHVIPTGVDLDYFRPAGRQADNERMIFVGYFQHHPNVDAMLYFCGAILPRIRAEVPGAELLIVGNSPPREIRELESIVGVRVTGYVPDIRPWMASSSVYVVPLRLGVGIRGKILEAWGMALPVVATPLAAAGLRAEDGKNILVADDADDFAAHVVRLLKDPELRARIGMQGRATAERCHSWERAAESLDDLYRRCLGLGPREARVLHAAGGTGIVG